MLFPTNWQLERREAPAGAQNHQQKQRSAAHEPAGSEQQARARSLTSPQRFWVSSPVPPARRPPRSLEGEGV